MKPREYCVIYRHTDNPRLPNVFTVIMQTYGVLKVYTSLSEAESAAAKFPLEMSPQVTTKKIGQKKLEAIVECFSGRRTAIDGVLVVTDETKASYSQLKDGLNRQVKRPRVKEKRVIKKKRRV